MAKGLPHAADEYAMGAGIIGGFHRAVEIGGGTGQHRRAGMGGLPVGAGEIIRRQRTGTAGKAIGDIGLIVAQRSYEMNSRALQVSDEMLQTSTQIVR